MAIRIRRGNQIDFDKNKLVQGELAIVLDAGELHFCYGAGNTKRLATKEDLQQMLDMSETSYSAFIQLIADLETNPNELTNILSNISALQTGKLDKMGDTKDNITTFVETETDTDIATGETHSTIFGKILKSIKTLRTGKIDKSDIIQTDTTNDTTKVPSSAVTYALGQEIDMLNNNLTPLALGLHLVKDVALSGNVATLSHTMNKSDFNSEGIAFENTGTYLLVTTNWGTTPSTGLYLISYSGGATANSTLTTIAEQTGIVLTVTSGVIEVSGTARIRLYALS